MTALLGVFGAGAAEARSTAHGSGTHGIPEVLSSMLSRMAKRGTSLPEHFVAPAAFLASRRFEWEAHHHGWSGPALTVTDDWVVLADASLYYVADLRRKLGTPIGTSGELLVAALRRWGDQFAQHLEGDFAIIARHRASGRTLLARDFVGKRGLAWCLTSDGTLVVASSPLAVVEHPLVSRSLDADFIAASISGLHGHGDRTAFRNVAVVPGGGTLAFDNGKMTRVAQWVPPPFSSDWERRPSDAAADQLRLLIEEAVVARLPDAGTATVWMSGGWDSTAIYAAGRAGLGRRRRATQLLPVSLRYPEGDTGDESPLIESIARRWNAHIEWLPVDRIQLFDDADRRAAVRDDPRVHPFESQIRALCATSRAAGARVALDGAGGDHLFTVSTAAILADHFRAGRLKLLWDEWRGWGRRNLWTFARSIILPQFSASTVEWIGAVRGRALPGFWDSAMPPWVRVTERLRHESVAMETRDPAEGVAAWETRDLLTSPLVARALSWNHAISLEEGILLGSPLFDRRIIEFAASRPLNERLGGPDSKVLLRRAMRELLPAQVLEPRGRKTGTPVDYFRREMRSHGIAELDRWFGSGRKSRLESIEVVDPGALKSAINDYRETGSHAAGALLQLTLEAERWLAVQELAR